MIKLARNTLADIGIITDLHNDTIKWYYIVKLHQVQAKYILHLGNKLKVHHIKWQNHKMKGKVAAQTLSTSAAAAITFLSYIKLQVLKIVLPQQTLYKNKFGKATKKPVTK